MMMEGEEKEEEEKKLAKSERRRTNDREKGEAEWGENKVSFFSPYS